MPRLGSRFFDSYNGQIDRLRKRRGENVQAFNSFVKMRQEMGEVASVQDMEKFRNALGGGENYFLSALPTNTMLEETNKAMVSNRADLQETRAQNALKTTTTELDLVKSIAGTVIDQDFNDVTENGGRSKIADAFKKSGNENLYKEYEGMLPNIMDTARTEQTSRWVEANGFSDIETKEGKESLLALAPTWMKSSLNTQGDAIVKRANDTKIAKAITEVQKDMAGIINDAAGDIGAVEKSVKARLIQKLGPLYTDEIFETMKEIVSGDFTLDLASRTSKALSNVQVDDDQLVGAKGNEALLRELAKQALVKGGLVNPTEGDIDKAVAQLEVQQRSALRADFETKLNNAVTKAESFTSDDAKLINGNEEIDNTVEQILSGAFPNYDTLNDAEKAEAATRVRAIIANKSALANEAETIADNEFVIAAIQTDGVLKSLFESGPSADRMKSIYDQINILRTSRGLSEMSEEDLKKTYGKAVELLMKSGARKRYVDQVAKVNVTAKNTFDAIMSQHKERMEGVVRELPEEYKDVGSFAEANWIPRTSSGYSAFQDALLAMIKDEKPPENANEANALADKIAMSLNWLPRGSAQGILTAEALRNENLIEPGITADRLVEDEVGALNARLLPKIMAIKLKKRDIDVTSTKSNLLEAVDEWEKVLISDLASPDIKYLISDMARVQEHIAKIKRLAEKAREEIRQTVPEGQYSFMSFLPQVEGGVEGGTYLVSDQQKDREKVIENGFEPGAIYKKLEDGSFEKVLDPVVTPDGAPVNNAGTQGADGIQQINPDSTPFVQDLQGIGAEMDITTRLRNKADDIIVGRDGYAGTSPAKQFGNYFFGKEQSAAQIKQRELDDKVAQFLRSPEAILYLRANPTTIGLMESDPYTWARQAGLQ